MSTISNFSLNSNLSQIEILVSRTETGCNICGQSVLIPGLDGFKCLHCGWVGTCRQCSNLATVFTTSGICLGCDHLNRQAALERKRKKKRAGRSLTGGAV